MSQLEASSATRTLLRGRRHKDADTTPRKWPNLQGWKSFSEPLTFDASINLLDLQDAVDDFLPAGVQIGPALMQANEIGSLVMITCAWPQGSFPTSRINLLESRPVSSSGRNCQFLINLPTSANANSVWTNYGSQITRTRDQRLARLRSIGRMSGGWDGADALPISAAAIDQARAFVNGLARLLSELHPNADKYLPFVDPSPEGYITLYWSLPGFLLTCDFRGNGKADWCGEIEDVDYEDDEILGDEWHLAPKLISTIMRHAQNDTDSNV